MDTSGKVVKSWINTDSLGENTEHTITWDLNDNSGTKVSAGQYCFEIIAAGKSLKSDYFTVYSVSDFNEGNGSPSSPYKISDLEQLKKIVTHNGRCFEQTQDIDAGMSSVPSLFTNDAPFTGIYDGKNFEIKNIINSSDSDYYALFSSVGTEGKLKNITLSGCSFSGKKYVATLVAYNKGNIEKCSIILHYLTQTGQRTGLSKYL